MSHPKHMVEQDLTKEAEPDSSFLQNGKLRLKKRESRMGASEMKIKREE